MTWHGLGYTVQVLHEALRLCPPAATVTRRIMQDIEVDGYRVEAGTFAVVGIYAMHRDPRLWDDPLTFDPDRFSPQRSKGRAAGSTCRSAADRVPASAITSRCWRPPWRWPRSCGRPASRRSITTFLWRHRSPLSPPPQYAPEYTRANSGLHKAVHGQRLG